MTIRLYVHTNKGVKRGCPADRVFLVLPPEWFKLDPGDEKYLVAWKCTIKKNGLSHPAFRRLLKFTEADLTLGMIEEGKNGSDPTAYFKPDSLYQEISVAELVTLFTKRKEVIKQQEER